MRYTVVGILLAVSSFVGPLLLDRLMSEAPNLAWRIVWYALLLIGVTFACLSGPIYTHLSNPKSHQLTSLLAAIAAAAVVVGGAWWFFVLQPRVYPIEINAWTRNVTYQPGAVVDGVTFGPNFTELRFFLANTTTKPFKEVRLVLNPDVPIVEIRQTTPYPVAHIEPVKDTKMLVESVDTKTKVRTAIPTAALAIGSGYLLQIEELKPKQKVNLLMAIGEPIDEKVGVVVWPSGNDYFKDKTDPKMPIEKYFLPRKVATKVKVTGSFSVSGDEQKVEKEIAVQQFKIPELDN